MAENGQHQGASKGLAIPIPPGAQFVASTWIGKRLRELKLYPLTKSEIDLIPVRSIPSSLKLWWKYFQETENMNLMQLQVSSTTQGLLLYLKDSRVDELVKLWKALSEKARKQHDRDAGQALEGRPKFDYQKQTPYTGTIKSLQEIEGMMGAFMDAIGLDQGKAYTFCMMRSFEEIGDRDYNITFRGEMKHFWEHIKDRTTLFRSRENPDGE